MSQQGQISEAGQSLQDDQLIYSLHSTHTTHTATKCHIRDASEIIKTDILSYDWEKTLQKARAFKIPEIDWEINSFEDDFMVPEPPSLSGIIDSTTNNSSSSKTTTDKEENYIVDDMSSLSSISDVKVSNSPRKHTFVKERVERKGNIYDKLYNACLKGQTCIINDILKQCTTALMPDENGQTPLYAACIGDHPEVVNLLLGAGYDVNHQDIKGKTALHIAFENDATDLAQALITQFHTNTELRDTNNWTPLHTAIDRGYYSFSQQLLQSLHQDVGTQVSWIQLQAACSDENIQDVKLLLDANSDVNHVSSAGHTPLHIAVAKSNIDIVTLLLDLSSDVNCKTFEGKTPLHVAVDKGEETIVQKLLSKNTDASLKDASGNTSLHIAVQLKQKTHPRVVNAGASSQTPFSAPYHACSAQTVQAIIEHGADVNAANNRCQTALWFACFDGQGTFVKILLDAGADPNITDDVKESSLHSAIRGYCSIDTVMEIIHHGADIDAVNDNSATPLLIACNTGQTESVRCLLKLKADPNIANINGYTSLHSTCKAETLLEIIDYCADVNVIDKIGRTALLRSCINGYMDQMKVLLEAGADPTIADEEGLSCLNAAIHGHCSKDTLQELLDHGAHIDVKTEDGANALLYACTKGQSESVIILLEAGADVNITTPDGNTILHLAVSGCCSKETLHKTVLHGVDVNAVNSNHQTALLLACGAAQNECVQLLLVNGADPNISESIAGYRSIHAAVLGKCAHKTLQEIANKAYIDAQSLHGHTALHLACLCRQQDTVKILLKAEANPNIACEAGQTSLHAAAFGGCSKKIIRALIKN